MKIALTGGDAEMMNINLKEEIFGRWMTVYSFTCPDSRSSHNVVKKLQLQYNWMEGFYVTMLTSCRNWSITAPCFSFWADQFSSNSEFFD